MRGGPRMKDPRRLPPPNNPPARKEPRRLTGLYGGGSAVSSAGSSAGGGEGGRTTSLPVSGSVVYRTEKTASAMASKWAGSKSLCEGTGVHATRGRESCSCVRSEVNAGGVLSEFCGVAARAGVCARVLGWSPSRAAVRAARAARTYGGLGSRRRWQAAWWRAARATAAATCALAAPPLRGRLAGTLAAVRASQRAARRRSAILASRALWPTAAAPPRGVTLCGGGRP
jgi:hypothetical protein